jgi:hypothetical protein
VTLDPVYDPIDTLWWMVAEARSELERETYTDESGRSRRKPKDRRSADVIRYETLCEVLWNVAGRPAPLEEVTARGLAAA